MNMHETIMETYKKLVVEQKTADVSVTDICRESGISRKTFYNYYSDRYDVVEKILLNEIEKPLQAALKVGFPYDVAVRMIFEHFLLSKQFYSIVLLEEGYNSMVDRFVLSLTELIQVYDPKPELSRKESEYVNYRFASDLTMLIRKWVTEGMKESPEFMSRVYVYTNDRMKKQGNTF